MQNEKPRDKISIDAKTLAAIEAALSESSRVELTPVKGGVKIFQVKRREIGQINIMP